jgi:hypothetical protein
MLSSLTPYPKGHRQHRNGFASSIQGENRLFEGRSLVLRKVGDGNWYTYSAKR